MTHHVVNLDGSAGLMMYEVQRGRHAPVLNRHDVGAAPRHNMQRFHHQTTRFADSAAHQLIEQFRRAIPTLFRVHGDARQRRIG